MRVASIPIGRPRRRSVVRSCGGIPVVLQEAFVIKWKSFVILRVSRSFFGRRLSGLLLWMPFLKSRRSHLPVWLFPTLYSKSCVPLSTGRLFCILVFCAFLSFLVFLKESSFFHFNGPVFDKVTFFRFL